MKLLFAEKAGNAGNMKDHCVCHFLLKLWHQRMIHPQPVTHHVRMEGNAMVKEPEPDVCVSLVMGEGSVRWVRLYNKYLTCLTNGCSD